MDATYGVLYGEDTDEAHVEPRPKTKAFIVAVYLGELAWGGPEEGGWWFNTGELVRIMRVFKNEDSAYCYCSRLNIWLSRTLNKELPPKSSVISDGVYEAHVYEDFAPRHFPEQRPHYE